MGYRSTIQQDWHVQVFRSGNSYQILVNIGVDDAIRHTYSLAVGLSPAPGGVLEYYFTIIDSDDASRKENPCYSGLHSADVLPKVQRGAVLRAILHATRSLLLQVNPEYVCWSTWDRDLPDKALKKFSAIVKVFELANYTVTVVDPHNGQHFWSTERIAPPGFPFSDDGGDE